VTNLFKLTFNNDPNNYDIVQLLKHHGIIKECLLLVSTNNREPSDKKAFYTESVWSRTASPVAEQDLPLFISAKYRSEAYQNILKG